MVRSHPAELNPGSYKSGDKFDEQPAMESEVEA